MSSPLVSIIIPCYNVQEFVAEAIESALRQSYRPIEVIVVDDGSTDRTLEIIRTFSGPVRWVSGPNRGACAARNIALRMAEGDLVQYLDADDLLRPEKLSKQVAVHVRTGCDQVQCDVEYVSLDGISEIQGIWRPDQNADPVIRALRHEPGTIGPLHRKDILVKVEGFREALPCAQERDLHIRLACEDPRIEYIPEVLGTTRRRRGSLSSNSSKVLDQYADIAGRAYEYLMMTDRLNEHRKRAFAGFMARAAVAYLSREENLKAQGYFEMARRFHPDGGMEEAFGRYRGRLAQLLGPARVYRALKWGRRTLLHR